MKCEHCGKDVSVTRSESTAPLNVNERALAAMLTEAVRQWVHARAFSDSFGLLDAEHKLNETFRKVVGLE